MTVLRQHRIQEPSAAASSRTPCWGAAAAAALLLFNASSVSAFQVPASFSRQRQSASSSLPVSLLAAGAAARTENNSPGGAEQERDDRRRQHQQQLHHHRDGFWGKERTRDEIRVRVASSLAEVDNHFGLSEAAPSRVEVLSAEPPLVVVRDFLSSEMCDAIVESAAQHGGGMKRSTTGPKQNESKHRTSTTIWLKDSDVIAADDVEDDDYDVVCARPNPLRLIATKVAAMTGLPANHQENLQVVRYTAGQQFGLHTDHQNNFNDLQQKGRLATCLIYLREPRAAGGGGETWFPGINEDLNGNGGEDIDEVRVAPKRGSAVFFWNTVERPGCDGYSPEMYLNADPRMRHAGLPVIADKDDDGGDDVNSNEKWICNKWVHPINFGANVRGL